MCGFMQTTSFVLLHVFLYQNHVMFISSTNKHVFSQPKACNLMLLTNNFHRYVMRLHCNAQHSVQKKVMCEKEISKNRPQITKTTLPLVYSGKLIWFP